MSSTQRQPTLFPIDSGQSREDVLLTVAQVAALANVTDVTVRTWINQGRLRALRTSRSPGGHYRIRHSELMRFFAELERDE